MCSSFFLLSLVLGVFCLPGIFPENIFKYQNDHTDDFGGTILAQEGLGAFQIFHVYYWTFSVRDWPLGVEFIGPF